MSDCIRRPGSEWTGCPCVTCRPEQRRKAKMRRVGHRAVVDVRPQAWARVVAWVEAGYSPMVIAGLAGVGRRASDGMVNAVKTGQPRPIHHDTARRIMAAPDKPTDGGGWVPSIGTVRRLQALTVMGWSMRDLASRCDLAESTLHALRDPKHRTTRPKFAIVVEALYDELSGTRGACRHAATRARGRGWLPPAAWDNIDDPNENAETNAEPVILDEVAIARLMTGARVTATRDEQLEAVRRMAEDGYSDHDIAQRVGVNDRTVMRWRRALGIESRWVA